MCGLLSSGGITRPLRYYKTIRLPAPYLPSSLFDCPAYFPHFFVGKAGTGPPGLPYNHNVKHAMVSDPGEASINLPFALMPMLTSTTLKVLSFSTRHLRGSIPSTFRLTAYLLAVLRL